MGRGRWGDIVGVLPRPVEVGVVVGHAAARPYAAQAAKQAGWTSLRAEQTQQKRSTSGVSHHAAIKFLPYAVETCGYRGMHAARLANRVGDIAAESECIPGGACVCHACAHRGACAGRCTCCRFGAEGVPRSAYQMNRRSGQATSRQQGMRHDAGTTVPVLLPS